MKLSDIPKSELAWVEKFRLSSLKFRLKLVDLILQGVKEFQSKHDKKFGETLFKQIAKSGEFKLIGVSTCVPYIKVEGDKRELEKEYVHAFGMPTLLYHVKGTPMLVMINPALRFDGNVLQESEQNQYDEVVRGITS